VRLSLQPVPPFCFQMLSSFLQDRALLYASGGMPPEEREQFEGLLEFEEELRDYVNGLLEIGAGLMLGRLSPGKKPSPAVRSALQSAVGQTPQSPEPARVYCGTDGLVKWVSAAFIEMCGYSEDELRGKKLGPLLQGALTDAGAAGRLRTAVRECRACCETLVNYHKDGHPYWVEIDMTPICDDEGRALFLTAREKELPGDFGS